MKIIVGSKNPTKIKAVEGAFKVVFAKEKQSFFGYKTPSFVSDQPMTEKETYLGAKNRVNGVLKKYGGDFFVGIEGGCVIKQNKMFAFAWVITSNKKVVGVGKTSMFQLPKEIQTLLESGLELGLADDLVFNRKDSKSKDGAVGILTKGIINRTEYYKGAVIMSLIPFRNKKLSF